MKTYTLHCNSWKLGTVYFIARICTKQHASTLQRNWHTNLEWTLQKEDLQLVPHLILNLPYFWRTYALSFNRALQYCFPFAFWSLSQNSFLDQSFLDSHLGQLLAVSPKQPLRYFQLSIRSTVETSFNKTWWCYRNGEKSQMQDAAFFEWRMCPNRLWSGYGNYAKIPQELLYRT